MTAKPGSEYARNHGCTCPVLDNNHGKRAPWPPDGWWINPDCPLHRPKEKPEADQVGEPG